MVVEGAGPLYADFNPRFAGESGGAADGAGARVTKFRRGPLGEKGALEEDGRAAVNDALVAVNGKDVSQLLFKSIVKIIQVSELCV